MHPVFGFPTFIRFSWSTIPKLIADKEGVEIVWYIDWLYEWLNRKEDLEEEVPGKKTSVKRDKPSSINNLLSKKKENQYDSILVKKHHLQYTTL